MNNIDEKAIFSVLVIDDHPLFRKGVLQLLEMDDAFRVSGEASSGSEGVAKAMALNPDLILLDLNMKDSGGLETLQYLRQENVASRVAVLTVSDDPEDVIAALRLGADGYLLKDMEPEDMLRKLSEIASGKTVLSESLTERLAQGLRNETKPKFPGEAGLTLREQEILDCIAEGMSNKLIARQLDIMESTVKVHVKHLLKKLNVHSRLEAAVWAVESAQGRASRSRG